MSPRIDALQRSVENLRVETRADTDALQRSVENLRVETRADIQEWRSEISSFKNTVTLLILGSWLTMMAAFIATRFIE